MALENLMTKKQIQVLKSYLNDDWKAMILSGAVRSGKTYIDNYIFLLELRRVAELAKRTNDTNPKYILAGFSNGSIYNNIISELSSTFGIEIKFDSHRHFKLFGVEVVPAYTGSVRGLGAIRGMTSYGAYVNEASLATYAVFQEIIQRCSQPNARIICDTNPDTPTHWLKAKYIDNKKPEAKIKVYNFTIDDNTFLDPDYVKTLKASTPSGMFYDRNIKGLWVTGDGVVYPDFDKKRMVVDKVPDGLTCYCGVDWGFEHKGSLLVFGDDEQGNTYLIEEHTHQHRFISYWVDLAHKIQDKYGHNINFWCDSARPDNLNEFQTANISAFNAKKAILPGVESVAKLMKTGHFFVKKGAVESFFDEIYQYIWNEQTGEPLKENDDVMDAMRYAIYNQHLAPAAMTFKTYLGG